MYANSEHHIEAMAPTDRPMPAPTAPAPDAHLSVARRLSAQPDGGADEGAKRLVGGRRTSRGVEAYIAQGAPGLTGVSVSALIQDDALSGFKGGPRVFAPSDDAAHAADGAAGARATGAPAETALSRARADSRSSVERATLDKARRHSANLTAGSFVSPTLSLSSMLVSDYGDVPAEPAAPAAVPALGDRRSSAEEARAKAIAASHAHDAPAPHRVSTRRPSVEAMLKNGGASRAPPMSVAAMLDPEFVGAPILRDGGDGAASRAPAEDAPAMSAIERARRVNYDAAIARGDAPKRRPSKDVSEYVRAGGNGPAQRPTVSELLGH